MWGIIPAAGQGSRIQPLAFSKELLPVGSRAEEGGERPRAVSEYLVDRMVAGGADKLCFVVSPTKSDILAYFGGARFDSTSIAYVVQPQPAGLCDAIFRAAPLISPGEHVLVGLPDTLWFPEDGFSMLPDGIFSFLLFPVEHPELFDVVRTDASDHVIDIQVKPEAPYSQWVWGGFKMPGTIFHQLHALWRRREQVDEYFGTLVNAWMSGGGRARAYHVGTSYVDVGTLNGYHQALQLLAHEPNRFADLSGMLGVSEPEKARLA